MFSIHRAVDADESRASIEWVLIAKGIGIILVVAGHFQPEPSPAYWCQIRKAIYAFHMPLFFILSGYLFRYGSITYKEVIFKKIRRLGYPFMTVAAAFFLIKLLAGRIVRLEHTLTLDSLSALLIDPIRSYAPLLWFVQALLIIFMVYPVMRSLLGDTALLVVFIALNTIFGNHYAVFGKALANMPFFIVGILFREDGFLLNNRSGSGWHRLLSPALIFGSLYLLSLRGDSGLIHNYPVTVCIGLTGSLIVIIISQSLCPTRMNAFGLTLKRIGFASMSIYLLHTPFESLVRITCLQIIDQWVRLPFESIAALAIVCGVFPPLLLETRWLRKNQLARVFFLGLAVEPRSEAAISPDVPKRPLKHPLPVTMDENESSDAASLQL